MKDPKRKNQKNNNRNQQKNPETGSKNASNKTGDIKDIFLGRLKEAFTAFDEIPQLERANLYGDQKYLEQFWIYFTEKYPDLLDRVEKKDLPIYIKSIEDKGFSIANIKENAGKLADKFKADTTELHLMEQSLEQLQKFCEDKTNNIPDGTFKNFADDAGFSDDTLFLDSDGKLQTIEDLYRVWKEFLEKKGITLENDAAEKAGNILIPEYNPTERIMVSVALTKIKIVLKGSLRSAFNVQFPLPVTVFSPYQDLLNFKDKRAEFLGDHASEIDESLAQELDALVVTNGDIQRELFASSRKIDTAKGFIEQEQYFKKIFNKFVTRQLFEEVKKTQESIDHHLEAIGTTFRGFPPYVSDVLDVYPFDTKLIGLADTSFESDIEHLSLEIVSCDAQFQGVPEIEKKELRKKIKAMKEEIEYRKWQGYIVFLKTKNAGLAEVFNQLILSKFDFSTLSAEHQQFLVTFFVKNKLEDTIKNKVPELLSLKEEELTQFMDDLFDLKKMDINIPIKDGFFPLTFLKKEFFASARKQLTSINDLEDLKNLPLNFLTQLNESNAAFFEESLIFDSLYTDFKAKNGKIIRINDSYRVSITKGGKTVEGYLSAYSPIDEQNIKNIDDKNFNGKELYLYSEPITAPNQERKLVTRPDDKGNETKIPVVIKDDDEQKLCYIDILDKKLNLNGDAFGALLLGYVIGKQEKSQKISPEKEKALADKLGKLEVYKEKEEGEEEESKPVPEKEKTQEESEKEKFMNKRNTLKGYAFTEPEYKENGGFVKGTRLFIPWQESEVPPLQGRAWLQIEIVHVDQQKGTWKVKFHGGELKLGASEGTIRELPINASSLEGIEKAFGDKIYKLPDVSDISKYTFDEQMKILGNGGAVDELHKYFGSLKFDESKFTYDIGNYAGKQVTHFGLYEPKAIDEDIANETGQLILYKIHPNANGTIMVSGDPMAGNSAKNFPPRDMDYATFILFIRTKGLQPKCKEQLQAINPKSLKDTEVATTTHGISINSIIGFFKNGVSKINDGMKKYDEERTEELTDLLTGQGQLWTKIGGFLGPFDRIASSFETMGMDYYLARDGRIWKKVETWVKFYEDYDYTKLYTEVIGPMLKGDIKIHPHYKIAAILLVHLKKGKGPYAKNISTTEGKWVGMILGKDHQQRYLAIREKKIRELEENAHIYGGPWADQIKNELVELEMRYMVHVMDARHMGTGDPDKYYFQDKYSQKFCSELEGAYTGFFKQDGVEEGFSKNKDANFEFAAVEYFRQLSDRPQQALPYLKVMATKAINDTQWQVFESAVLAGILAGVFLNMTYSSTQSYIQKICRTRGFLPGLFAKDIKQQSKMQRLLDLFSGGKFSEKCGYDPAKLSFRHNIGPKDFITSFKKWTDGTIEMKNLDDNTVRTGGIRNELSKFLDLTGKNANGLSLFDLHSAKETSASDRALLAEYIKKSNEQNEGLDPNVSDNTSSLTGSILTKSQSVVDKMIKINEEGFAAKDGDEKQNMQAFSEGMQKVIPEGKIKSPEKIKFFLGKFFNRFGERFSGNKKMELLKRLKFCNNPKNASAQDVEDILNYSIVGEIIGSLSSRETNPPDELIGALNAWKEFFKSNLDTILQPDVVADGFGNQYAADLSKYSPELEPWETAALLLDREDFTPYMNTLSKEQRTSVNEKKRKISNENIYINKKLYALAEELGRKCSGAFPNRFKNKKPHLPKPPKATGARINNPEIVENIRRVLEGKNPQEEDEDFLYQRDYDNHY